jgi:ribulose-5-phosphate 4-epimerase/fuculose-1-phosphate aldolase
MNEPDAELIDKLVLANRILYDQGVVDGLGHASMRLVDRPGCYLLSCNRAPALVRRRDIVAYDFDGNAISPTSERPYLERFIHGEIYRSRPDVIAVVHSHSPNVIPFAATRSRLRPVFHMAGFLGAGSAHFDTRDDFGDTDMLIRNPALGRSLAQSLGNCACVLMRGHGSTVVGSSLEQVVYRAIYTEVNARLQWQAHDLGETTFLNEAEAALAAQANDGQIPRSWALWVKRLGLVDLDQA